MPKYRIVSRRAKGSVAPKNEPTLPKAPDVTNTSEQAAFALYEEFFGGKKAPAAPATTNPESPVKEPVSSPVEEPSSAKEPVSSPVEEPSAPAHVADIPAKPAQAEPDAFSRPDGSDTIDPSSMEPTREFSFSDTPLEDVAKAKLVGGFINHTILNAKEASDADFPPAPAPLEAPQLSKLQETETLLASVFKDEDSPRKRGLFGRRRKKEASENPADIASQDDAEDAAVTLPTPIADFAPIQMEATIPIPKEAFHLPAEDASSTETAFVAKNAVEKEVLSTAVSIDDLVRERVEAKAAEQELSDEPQQDPGAVEEFTAPEQAEGLFAEFRREIAGLWRRIAGLIVLLLASVYIEGACFTDLFPYPTFLQPGKYGIVYLLVDLQIVILTAFLARGIIFPGAKRLFSGKTDASSVVFVAWAVSLVEVLVLLGMFRADKDYMLFATVSVFLALIASLRSLMEARQNIGALRILASEKVKYAACVSHPDGAEAQAFSEYLGEDSELFTVNKTRFADGFVARIREPAPGNAMFAVGIPIAFLAAVGIALWCYSGSHNLIHALSSFAATVMMGLPACSLFAAAFPFYCASRRAAREGTALVGPQSVEEYGNAEVISFDDTEVFLPKHVKVMSVRTYGSARIDKILVYCAQIFRVVGGPLSFVFENSVSSLAHSLSDHVDILENDGTGICARVDGREIFLGGADYMEAYEFPIETEDSDATFEETVGRIMYLAIDSELAAKFYIKYAVSARFESQLRALNRAGIYAAVKTCDPNIDDVLLSKILRNSDYPIGVLKTGSAALNAPPSERANSGLVGISKVSGLLNGFLLCEAVRSRTSMNTLTKFVSMLLGIFITAILAGLKNANLSPAFCLLYNAIWLLPVILPSLFDWPQLSRRKKRH